MEVTTKKQAQALGLDFYFTGKPCKRGHSSMRRVDNSTCIDCITERNAEFYRANSDREKKRSSLYKSKNKERDKVKRDAWKEANPDKVKLYAKNNYAANREKIAARNKAYRDANKEMLSEKAREYRKNNREKLKVIDANKYKNNLEAIKQRSKKYREKNKDMIAKQKRKWMDNNQEKVKASRWRRKSLIRNADGSFSAENISFIFYNQGGKCACCLCSITDGYDIDHIQPLSRGGTNYPENLQLLCRACNRSKSNKDPYEWAQERGMLL